jgi:hypothetical protein
MSTGFAPRFHEEMVRKMFISSAAALGCVCTRYNQIKMSAKVNIVRYWRTFHTLWRFVEIA